MFKTFRLSFGFMRKQDFIRLQRTCGELRNIERRLTKIWERTYCSDVRRDTDLVDFVESKDRVLCDITNIQSRVAWARITVEDLLAKVYERK